MIQRLPQSDEEIRETITPWLQVARQADAFFARVIADHADEMQCGPGCNECCHPDLTVLPTEGLAILLGLSQLNEAQLVELRRNAANAERRRCPLLVEQGLCAVYELRPLICRTHGLPVLQDGQVSLCPLNFPAGIPEGAVLNGNILVAQLAVADAIVRGEENAADRVSIARLVLEGVAALKR